MWALHLWSLDAPPKWLYVGPLFICGGLTAVIWCKNKGSGVEWIVSFDHILVCGCCVFAFNTVKDIRLGIHIYVYILIYNAYIHSCFKASQLIFLIWITGKIKTVQINKKSKYFLKFHYSEINHCQCIKDIIPDTFSSSIEIEQYTWLCICPYSQIRSCYVFRLSNLYFSYLTMYYECFSW